MNKKVIVFDLDGTLAKSKSSLDPEMTTILCDLLKYKKVAIISGGGFKQFQKQVLDVLNCGSLFNNLYIFPTKGATMYKYDGSWKKIYENSLTKEEKEKVISASKNVIKEVNFLPKETECFGDMLEDRESQFTFSALGQNAPSELKEDWDKDVSKRKELKKHFEKYLPEFQVEIGGKTSIDITKKGIDKAYAIEELSNRENIKIEEMAFVGDALFQGGNDYPVKKTGIDTVEVKDYNETKEVIKKIISSATPIAHLCSL